MVCILKEGMVLAIENASRKKVKKIVNRELHKSDHRRTVEGMEREVDAGGADTEINGQNGAGSATPNGKNSGGSATPNGSSSSPSRFAFGCDTSPLADIDLLRKARESAQAEAEASGNGKRAK
ncbi:unnamed protein product, partial [Laminaria digitata]